jgi:sigma-B regulation protein RsbU (phosphoserine phosphatase)
MAGAFWDITERKTMEEQLSRERFFLRTLAEHLPDKIYFKDTESHFIWASHQTLALFGTNDPAKVIGKTDFDFFREEHARTAYNNEREIVRTGKPLVNLEERETWADGRETWVSTTKMPLRDAQGRIIGTFGLSRDITERKKAEAQLAKYAEELRRRNEELEQDLGMARELQNALMPRRYPCFPHNATPSDSALHFSHFFNPSTAVSGDFFDILELSDNTAGIFICDVMGHGVRAALVAAIVRALVGELKSIGHRPGEFLQRLNEKLSGILKQTDIPMFASAFYVVVDLAKSELRYANAGHPDPLCVRHDVSDAQAVPLNHCKRGPVLGMFGGAEYGTSRMPLSVHDMVLLFTDGLFEVESADGELYDQKSLMRAVNQRANLHAGDLCGEVLAEIRQFSAKNEFDDDVCLVALEVERLGG